MKRNYIINKKDLQSFLQEASAAMTKTKTFYNLAIKEHKTDENKIIVIMG